MMFLCKLLAAAARRRQPAPEPPGDTDDSFLRYTFEDDSDFSTQITDRDEENPLAEAGALLAGLGLSGVVATKVADGDGHAARTATQPDCESCGRRFLATRAGKNISISYSGRRSDR
jgi:hypothetical protein